MEKLITRRSCRKYIREPIPKADVEKIVSTALNYPCALCRQEVDFVVVTNREKLDKLGQELTDAQTDMKGYLLGRQEQLGVQEPMWCDAPCVIFLVANGPVDPHFTPENMGTAAASIIAVATDLGYSTLPALLPAFPTCSEITAKFLGVEKERVGLTIAIGKAHESWAPQPKEIRTNVKYIE